MQVTESDRILWVLTVSPHNYTPRAFSYYCTAYAVDRKVIAAKSRGEWPPRPCHSENRSSPYSAVAWLPATS